MRKQPGGGGPEPDPRTTLAEKARSADALIREIQRYLVYLDALRNSDRGDEHGLSAP